MTRVAPPAVLAGAVALAAVVAVADLTAPAAAGHRAATVSRARVGAVTLVCPDLAGQAGVSTTTLTVGAAPGVAGAGAAVLTVNGNRSPVTLLAAPGRVSSLQYGASGGFGIITVDGALAAGADAEQVTLAGVGAGRGLTGTRCAEPTRDTWFVGATGQVGTRDGLWLVNPDPTDALVDVDLWSEHGRVNAPSGEGIKVPASGRAFFALSDLAPDEQTVALHVVARTGRVSPFVSDERSGAHLEPVGSDWVPPTNGPARAAVVPGLPAGGGARALLLANPGQDDATVRVTVLTGKGQFVPTGLDALRVPSGKVTRVDLTAALHASDGAVSVTGDHPVLVEGFADSVAGSSGDHDLAWLASIPALAGPALVADNRVNDGWASRLLVTAPDRPSVVQVQGVGAGGRTAVVPVPAARTVAVDLSRVTAPGAPGGGVVVTPVAGAVYAARDLSLADPHGPLLTVQPVTALPGEVVRPAAREDLRAALPQPSR